MTQTDLWHDSLADALRALCMGLHDGKGRTGMKVVGAMLWPSLPADNAGKKLNNCLDPDRAEKLSLEEVDLLVSMGREQGVHVVPGYLAQRYGYQLTVVSQEAQRQTLMEGIAEQQAAIVESLRRLEAMG
jgi:hypothetical protein